MREREADVVAVELLCLLTHTLVRRHNRSLDDLNLRWAHTMPSCHVIVQLVDCAIQGHISELLVHVVRPTPRLNADNTYTQIQAQPINMYAHMCTCNKCNSYAEASFIRLNTLLVAKEK